MRSSFYGFEIAKTGLFAAQRAIDLTGHNIANANTAGYSRQRLSLSSIEISSGGARFLEVTRGYSGAGVRIDGVEQVRDNYLDREFRRESSRYEMWNSRSDALSYIEDLYNESSDSGLSQSIKSFFTSVHKLTENAESKEYRTNMLQNAQLMTEDFRQIATQLISKQQQQNEAVRVSSIQINDIATNIADLNDQIFRFELNGEKANDLRDQRNNLIDELSGIVDITYSEDTDGEVNVQIGGVTLVNRDTTTAINCTATTANPITGQPALYALTWNDGVNTPVTVTSGKVKAYMDMCSGNTNSDMGIPYFMTKLNELASGIAAEFNTVHRQGYSLPDASNGNTSVNNIDFFDVPVGGVTALNFSVSASIRNSVFNIAAAGSQIIDNTTRGNNANALLLDNLKDRTNLPSIGSIEGFLKGYIAEIGVETGHTIKMMGGEKVLVDNLSNQKQSISGVSVDEEMTNLIKFQQSYSAAARVITTIDEYLDVLINKTGLVGR